MFLNIPIISVLRGKLKILGIFRGVRCIVLIFICFSVIRGSKCFNWSTEQGQFINAVLQLHYVRLGQVRLRRSLRSAIGQVDHMLGQVRLLRRSLRSAIGPNYPQANRSTDQGRFRNSLRQFQVRVVHTMISCMLAKLFIKLEADFLIVYLIVLGYSYILMPVLFLVDPSMYCVMVHP